MQVKPYTISTVVAGLAAGAMGLAAANTSMRPLAENDARTKALTHIVQNLKADNCINIDSPLMPSISEPIIFDSPGKISTSCLYYPQHKRFAYIAQLNNQLQIIYLYTNTEVRKANG